MIRSILSTLLIYGLFNLFFLGLGLALGFLLHWIIAAVDLGVAILIGVVVTGLSLHFFIQLMLRRPVLEPLDFDDELDLELEPEPGPRLRVYPVAPLPPRRRRRK